LPTPLAPLKVIYGSELVERVLVEGQRVLPAALEASGYAFRHRTIDEAFAAVLD
jgi:NAD dependent epimerase/dehydratase family enzyme